MKSKRWIQLKKSDGLPQENEYKLIEVDLPALGEGGEMMLPIYGQTVEIVLDFSIQRSSQ